MMLFVFYYCAAPSEAPRQFVSLSENLGVDRYCGLMVEKLNSVTGMSCHLRGAVNTIISQTQSNIGMNFELCFPPLSASLLSAKFSTLSDLC